jgi:hypothetical protein
MIAVPNVTGFLRNARYAGFEKMEVSRLIPLILESNVENCDTLTADDTAPLLPGTAFASGVADLPTGTEPSAAGALGVKLVSTGALPPICENAKINTAMTPTTIAKILTFLLILF